MSERDITERLELLYFALLYSRVEKSLFSTSGRILINQERGRLTAMLSGSGVEPLPVPDHINEKVLEVDRLIKTERWKPLNDNPYE